MLKVYNYKTSSVKWTPRSKLQYVVSASNFQAHEFCFIVLYSFKNMNVTSKFGHVPQYQTSPYSTSMHRIKEANPWLASSPGSLWAGGGEPGTH